MAKLDTGNNTGIQNYLKYSNRIINLNDFHYARLKAIIKAESDLDAVTKFIKDQYWQIYRDSRNDEVVTGCEVTKGTLSMTPEVETGLKNLKVIEMKLNTSYGALRNYANTYADVQLRKYKIECDELPDLTVWVYRMGDHWVICN